MLKVLLHFHHGEQMRVEIAIADVEEGILRNIVILILINAIDNDKHIPSQELLLQLRALGHQGQYDFRKSQRQFRPGLAIRACARTKTEACSVAAAQPHKLI